MAPSESESLDSKGTNVWVPHDEEVWTRGTVMSASGGKVKVQTARGEIISASVKDLQLCHGSASQDAKMDDLTQLPDLHSPALLSAVAERFTRDTIYTFTGPILLAVNPFKPVKGLYSAKEMSKYMKALPSDEKKLPPHAYSIAEAAFKSMVDSKGENQSILVSGESGAGKTESTKIIMRYLTEVSAVKGKSMSAQSKTQSEAVAKRVLQANPLIEAFGNAKTIRNDNSSRFGKLIQLQFVKRHHILEAAWLDSYLLEKARVVHQAPNERNYHIFYELAAGASKEQLKRWKFPELSESRYTCQSGIYERADVDDKSQFKDTLKAMEVLDMSEDERDRVFRIVSAVLHLGDVDFDRVQGKEEEGSAISADTQASAQACCELLKVDAALLEQVLCSREISIGGGSFFAMSNFTGGRGFGRSMKRGGGAGAAGGRRGMGGTKAGMVAAGAEMYVKNQTVTQAREARDALAMTLYERLFGWIVFRINKSISDLANIQRKPSQAANKAAGGGLSAAMSRIRGKKDANKKKEVMPVLKDSTIACLDIFGFEVFERNSFEQLCINYCNEQLQQQFNEYVFDLEQKQYQAEGIDWSYISYPDNQACLEMIEARPIGLLSLLDEECLYPKGNDKSLANKFYEHLAPKFKHFEASRKNKIEFTFCVKHFAGDVEYAIDGFVKKNKNELRQEAVDFVRSSKDPLVAILLPQDATKAAGGADLANYFASVTTKKRMFKSSLERNLEKQTSSKLQQTTVGSHFKQQLGVAMNHIRMSQPHYIRCLKPNDQNAPTELDHHRLVEQLSYSGVLEVIRVTRAGYATRFLLGDFAERFFILMFRDTSSSSKRKSKRSSKRQSSSRKSRSRGGASNKVPSSLRDKCEKILEACDLTFGEDYQLGHTKVFMRPHAFTRLEVLKADRLKRHVLRLQAFGRSVVLRLKFTEKQRAVRKIQKLYRGYHVRSDANNKLQEFRSKRKAAEKLQAIQAKKDKVVFERRDRAANAITRGFRNLKDKRERNDFEQKQLQAALALQNLARRMRAQKIFNNLHAKRVTEAAATTIQSLGRVLAARKKVTVIQEEVFSLRDQWQEARRTEHKTEIAGGVEMSETDVVLLFAASVVILLITSPWLLAIVGLGAVAFVLGGRSSGGSSGGRRKSGRSRRNKSRRVNPRYSAGSSLGSSSSEDDDSSSSEDDDDSVDDRYIAPRRSQHASKHALAAEPYESLGPSSAHTSTRKKAAGRSSHSEYGRRNNSSVASSTPALSRKKSSASHASRSSGSSKKMTKSKSSSSRVRNMGEEPLLKPRSRRIKAEEREKAGLSGVTKKYSSRGLSL